MFVFGRLSKNTRQLLPLYFVYQDPRRGEKQWQNKESAEQAYRYRELRKDKEKLLSPAQLYKDHMHQESLVRTLIY